MTQVLRETIEEVLREHIGPWSADEPDTLTGFDEAIDAIMSHISDALAAQGGVSALDQYVSEVAQADVNATVARMGLDTAPAGEPSEGAVKAGGKADDAHSYHDASDMATWLADQRERITAILRAAYAIDAIRPAPVEEQVAKLQAFKDYVHQRLDEAGIPTHPDGEHSKEGCRVGDRLDIALRTEAEVRAAERERLAAECREHHNAQRHPDLTWLEVASYLDGKAVLGVRNQGGRDE